MKNKKSQVKITLLTIAILAISTGITYASLQLIQIPKADEQLNESADIKKPDLKPEDIISAIQTNEAIPELHENYQVANAENEPPVTLHYERDGAFATTLISTDTVIFKQIDVSKKDNNEQALASIETYMKSQELIARTDEQTRSFFTTYTGRNVTCQIANISQVVAGNAASLSIACIDEDAITAHYATIEETIRLYNGSAAIIAEPDTILLTSAHEGSKKITILNLYGVPTESKAISLIFAAIDDDWQYLGSRPISNGETAVNSTIPPELANTVNNPIYGDFLLRYIPGATQL